MVGSKWDREVQDQPKPVTLTRGRYSCFRGEGPKTPERRKEMTSGVEDPLPKRHVHGITK